MEAFLPPSANQYITFLHINVDIVKSQKGKKKLDINHG